MIHKDLCERECRAFRKRTDFSYANAVIAVDDHDFSTCKQPAIDQKLYRLVNGAIQLDHCSYTHSHNVSQWNVSHAEPNHDIKLDLEQSIDVSGGFVLTNGATLRGGRLTPGPGGLRSLVSG
jgi:hypothetical protein